MTKREEKTQVRRAFARRSVLFCALSRAAEVSAAAGPEAFSYGAAQKKPAVAETPTPEYTENETDTLTPKEAQITNIMVSNIISEARKRGVDLGGFYTATEGLNAFNPRRSDIPVLVDALRGIVKALKTDSMGLVDFDKYLSHIAGYGIAVAKEDGNNGDISRGPQKESRIGKRDSERTKADSGLATEGERSGETSPTGGEAVSLAGGKRLGKQQVESFKKAAIAPEDGSNAKTVADQAHEYGTPAYVIPKDIWIANGRKHPAASWGGEIFICSEISDDYVPIAIPHEMTHVMRQVSFQPYILLCRGACKCFGNGSICA